MDDLDLTPIICIIIGVILLLFIIFIRILKTGEFHPWYYRVFSLGSTKYHPIEVKHLASGYEEVRDKFVEHFQSGREVGASIVVIGNNGEVLVELYGGYSNLETKEIYSEHTLQLCYSCSKFVESVVLAKLVNQGYINYDDPVIKYWPGFGKNNKHGVTIADVMRHEGGLSYFSNPQPTFIELKDPAQLRSRIESERHEFNGEKLRSYHAVTRGLILNEIVTKAHPKKFTIEQICRTDINQDGIEFYLGLPEYYLLQRRAQWYSYPILDTLLTTITPGFILALFNRVKVSIQLVFNPWLPIHRSMKVLPGDGNSYKLTQLQLSSCSGYTNAKSLAKISSNLKRYLGAAGLDNALASPKTAFDRSLRLPTTFTQGGLAEFTLEELGDDSIKFYGWTGMGGSVIVFNLQYDFSIAYLMNAQHITFLLTGRSRTLLIAAFQAHRRAVDSALEEVLIQT